MRKQRHRNVKWCLAINNKDLFKARIQTQAVGISQAWIPCIHLLFDMLSEPKTLSTGNN